MAPHRWLQLILLVYFISAYLIFRWSYKCLRTGDSQYFWKLVLFLVLGKLFLQLKISMPHRTLSETRGLVLFKPGNYVDLYEHPTDPEKVIKQIKFGKKLDEMTDKDKKNQKKVQENPGWVMKGCMACHHTHCTVKEFIAWCMITGLMWKSNLNKYRLQPQTPAIAKLSELDSQNLSWAEEKVDISEFDQFVANHKSKIRTQLQEYSQILKQHGLRHYDSHLLNFGRRGDQIVSFDGEVVSPWWVWTQQILLGYLMGVGETIPYRDFDGLQFNGLRQMTPLMELGGKRMRKREPKDKQRDLKEVKVRRT